MGQKRSRDALPAVTRKRNKKPKKRTNSGLVAAKNQFEQLPEVESDSKYDDELVLIDSTDGESGDIVVVSDNDDDVEEIAEPSPKKQKIENELTKGNDFIEFGFSSSDTEQEEYAEYSDDGIISDDNSGASHSRVEATAAFPWVKGHDHSKQREIADWLTMEIKDFVNYISPSKDEIVVRNSVVNTLKLSITTFWPATQAHVFGSCATDLYLPGSDIDMVIVSSSGDYEQRSRLYQLSSHLRTHKLAKNIEVIATAKVPIIKFVDPTSNIHVDISFEKTNGLDAAKRIRRWLDLTPGLRELVLIVKQFLRSRKLNNVHVGGLGGYATIILVYHFLRLHPRVSTGNMAVMENLGTLLIEFFELYGRNFSFDDLIIAIDPSDDTPKYLLKSRHPGLTTGRGQFAIVIQDPSDKSNNITRSSYNLRDLKKAFGGAYQLLIDKCYELNGASYKNRIGKLILGDIIKYKGKDRDFNDDRDLVVNHALINHLGLDSESDGADGNDKYYFSDMTGSEGEYVESAHASKPKKGEVNSKQSKKKAKKEAKKVAKKASKKDFKTASVVEPTVTTVESTENGESQKHVADFMSLEVESENDDDDKKLTNLDKDVKREYWRLKGLETSI